MLTEIKIEIPDEAISRTDDALIELGDGRWSLLEDAIARRAWIVGIFDNEVSARENWARLEPVLPAPVSGQAELRGLEARDWADSYKDHFHAWHFGSLHWVPAWERGRFRMPMGHSVLWLDPGMAFGTGNHETTRLCVERLVALAGDDVALPRENVGVLDAGCGSGILALSAALLGFGWVEGFDIDPEAVRVSQENAAMNGLADRVKFSVGNLAGLPAGALAKAGVVLANIQADVLVASSLELTGAVIPGGSLVLSGILATERDAVLAAFRSATPDWAVDSRVLGDWSDILLTRPAAREEESGT
jgi:ribosomal protein L11 methyltransferase